MRAVDIIIRKRDGLQLLPEEIAWMVSGITDGSIPDYQVAAWLMAIYLQGMCSREVLDLTLQMAVSGGSLPGNLPFFLDKHSTGGVGDKTTLVVAPLVASTGVMVGKMSGRGLGHTGGTIDKLESIPGFRTFLDRREFLRNLDETGLCVAAQSPDMAPADGRLYALRDVTGTVESIPLIASSVVSKKIASGASGVVFDVKVGEGAFIQETDLGFSLARLMVDVSKMAGLKAGAIITAMNQPLGLAVGNALEVKEAIKCLKGEGPQDLREVSIDLGCRMLYLAGDDPAAARETLESSLSSGRALEAFTRMLRAQGGDEGVLDSAELLPRSPHVMSLLAEDSGYLTALSARRVGRAVIALGAGRMAKGDPVDHAVGMVLHKKVGDAVERGEPLAEVHHRESRGLEECMALLRTAFVLGPEPVQAPSLLLGEVTHK